MREDRDSTALPTDEPHDISAELLGQSIVTWLKAYLSDLLELSPEEVNEHTTFDRFGLDSSALVGMVGDLGEWLGVELDPAAAYDEPSIARLASFLAADERVYTARNNGRINHVQQGSV
jgi:acyl carrier protein